MPGEASLSRLAIPVTPQDHAQGRPDAPVTLVEYGDYECPYCLRAFPIIRALQREFGDSLRLVFRHFPQNSVHPHASVAAQMAEAAAAQGKFWEMHDLLYAHQDELAQEDLGRYALELGLEVYRFEADLSAERFARKVRQDYEGGLRSGVRGTPTLFINESPYNGAMEFDALRQAIAEASDG